MGAPPIYKYNVEAFLNRAAEQERAAGFIENLYSKELQDSRVLVFTGERGAGKSWLAHHLHNVLFAHGGDEHLPATLQGRLAKYSVDSFLICLSPAVEFAAQEQQDNEFFASPNEASEIELASILEKIGKYVGAVYSSEASLLDKTDALIKTIEQNNSDNEQLFVLILDSVFETDRKILQKLETFLLAPLVGLKNTAIIMTGRGPIPPWRSGDLRVNPEKDVVALETFDENDVYSQIEWHADDKPKAEILRKFAPQIFNVSHGFPLNTTYLAVNIPKQIKNKNVDELTPNDIHVVWTSVLNGLADFLLGQWRDYRQDFEAVSILQSFREWELAPVLDAYDPSANYATDQRKTRDKNNELLQTRLIQWSPELKAYEMHQPVKKVLETYLLLEKPDVWRNLHDAAQQLYLRMADQHTKFSNEFRERAAHHTECLEKPSSIAQRTSMDASASKIDDLATHVHTEDKISPQLVKTST